MSTSPNERTNAFYHARSPVSATFLTIGGVLVIYLVQIGAAPFTGPLPAAALSYLAVSVLLLMRKLDLGLARAPARFWIAAVLIGCSVWLLDLEVVNLVQPPHVSDTLEKVVAHDPLWATLIVLAVCPAIGEELLFRGVFARALDRPRRRWIAVVVSAIVFSTYHLDPAQMVGTALVGLSLGTLATGARSIMPGMVAHVLNNGVVLLVANGKPEPIVAVMDRHPDGTLVAAVIAFLAGISLAVKVRA